MPCARSLDPLVHPSLSMQVDRLGCHAVREAHERDREGRLRVGSCRVDLPRLSLRVLIRFRARRPGHIPRNLVAITKPVGCGKRASGRTHLLFPTGDGAHTHTATTSLQACKPTGGDPRRGQDNGVVGRREPTCLKPEFQRCPLNCSPNRLCCRFVGLLPVSTPRKSTVACTVCIFTGFIKANSCLLLLHPRASVLELLNSRPANGSSKN